MKTRMLISLLITLLALFLFGTALLSAQQTAPTVSLNADQETIASGKEFAVTIHVTEAQQVYGGSFKIAYDPQLLEVVPVNNDAIMPGAFFDQQPNFVLKNTADAETGVVEYQLTLVQPAQPVSGSGVIGAIQFRSLSSQPTTVELLEARLFSVAFTQVDGRNIAQGVQEIEVQLGRATVNLNDEAGVDTAPTLRRSQTELSTPVDSPATSLQSVQVIIPNNQRLLVMGVSILLLMLGLAIFAASISSYIHLRRDA
jgi:hypothetical protein